MRNLLILAQQNGADEHLLRKIGKDFEQALGNPKKALLLIAVLIGLGVVWYLVTKFKPFFLRRSQVHQLFEKLCEAHNLNRNQKRALRDFAKSLDLDNPNILFIRPSLFDQIGGEPQKETLEEISRSIFYREE